jgi:Flp pilus assembly pilin Flp
MQIIERVTNFTKKLHDDEEGLEAVQVVMIVAIAALVLIGVMTIGQEVFNWMKEKWNELKGQDIG